MVSSRQARFSRERGRVRVVRHGPGAAFAGEPPQPTRRVRGPRMFRPSMPSTSGRSQVLRLVDEAMLAHAQGDDDTAQRAVDQAWPLAAQAGPVVVAYTAFTRGLLTQRRAEPDAAAVLFALAAEAAAAEPGDQ